MASEYLGVISETRSGSASLPLGLSPVDGDALHARLRLRRFRHRHGEHAVLERGGHLILVHVLDRDAPLEATVIALAEQPVRVVRLASLLALDGERAVRELGLNFFLIEARQFRRDLDFPVGLADLNVRPA
jgi:hypothetical protein